MATEKDYFLHSNETLQSRIQILAPDDGPISIPDYDISMAVAKEFVSNTIMILSNANTSQIATIDSNNAIIQVNFTPNTENGFTSDANLVYQLQTKHKITNVTSIVQEGRIYITPSLFDTIVTEV